MGSWIRIRIKVESWIRIRIEVQKWKPYMVIFDFGALEGPKLRKRGRIQIRMKEQSTIRIRIEVMRIRNTGHRTQRKDYLLIMFSLPMTSSPSHQATTLL
jgi:hypothetical protein